MSFVFFLSELGVSQDSELKDLEEQAKATSGRLSERFLKDRSRLDVVRI